MKNLSFLIIILMLTAGCKQRYNPPVSSPATGYLVVEGFINSSSEPTSITLSRTTPLYDSVNNNSQVFEHNAQVSIESNANESFLLSETGDGVYTSSSLLLNNNNQYRLHIITTNGNQYLSDYTPVKKTPPIDSVNWQRDNNGVHIFIDTHDATNNIGYYQWQYDETWEFHSAFHSSLIYVITLLPDASSQYSVGYRLPGGGDDTTLFKCWHSPHSTQLLLGSSEKFTEDRIHLPLIDIAAGTQQLSVLYSVLVKQHAVSKSNFDFLQKMKKNTEGLGSIFDAQPSDIKGNIHCASDPNEQVIGFMEVSQLQTQRIYISKNDVPDWGYRQFCAEVVVDNISDSIKKNGNGFLPTETAKSDPFANRIVSFYASEPTCVDCRLTGSNVKPDFWP